MRGQSGRNKRLKTSHGGQQHQQQLAAIAGLAWLQVDPKQGLGLKRKLNPNDDPNDAYLRRHVNIIFLSLSSIQL